MNAPHGPSSLRGRLWKAWFFLAVLLVSLIVGNFIHQNDKAMGWSDIGLDFISFYRAGDLVAHHQSRLLYDLDATRSYDHNLSDKEGLNLGDSYGPFYYPPFFSLLFVPLASLPFHTAVLIWICFGIACFVLAAILICKMIPSDDWRDWALPAALMIVSMPFLQTIGHGQNTFVSLLLASLIVTAWRANRGFWAGCATGLLFYKPQLGAIILLVLVMHQGRRALLGAAFTGGILLLINLIALPGTVGDYLHQLPPNVQATLAFHPAVWQRHVTFRGFWQVLLAGMGFDNTSSIAAKLSLVCGAPLGLALLACAWRNRKSVTVDRLIAATIATMPLLMPYYLDYDLLLLALPAVLFAGEQLRRDRDEPMPVADQWLTGTWVGLFVLLMVPFLTSVFQFNLIVPCLTAIATMLIVRAGNNPVAEPASQNPAFTSWPSAQPTI